MKNIFSTRRGNLFLNKIKNNLNEYFSFTLNNSTNIISHINNEKLVVHLQPNTLNSNVYSNFSAKSAIF